MTNSKSGLRNRLSREFLLQAIYISIAAVLGVLVVAVLLESVLTREALRGEAEYYAERYARDRSVPLPNTRNMMGYRDDSAAGVPAAIQRLSLGFHSLDDGSEFGLVHVSSLGEEKLFLAFNNRSVRELVAAFGLAPLAIVLVVIYVALFLAYRISRRAVSPIITLADQVRALDPSHPDTSLFVVGGAPDDDIAVLSNALNEFRQRLQQFADRERNFTRDASHELRSPLTVIRMAAESLEKGDALDNAGRLNVMRIRRSAKDMEELTNAFLLLARQSNEELRDDWVLVNEIVAAEVERTQLLAGDKPVEVTMEAGNELVVAAPEQVIGSIVGNLLRNGLKYTDEGAVVAVVDGNTVTVRDTGPGIEASDIGKILTPFYRAETSRQRGGHGVGLTIVNRLCERFGWPLTIESELGVGTRVSISFASSATETPSSPDLHSV